MTTRIPLAISILLLTSSCAHVPPPVIPSPFSDADLHLRERLKAPMEPEALDINEQPLEKVLDELADQNKLNMIVDWIALNATDVEKTTPVTLHLRDVSVRTAIESILGSLNSTAPLAYRSAGGVLHISSRKDLDAGIPENYIRLRYDVRDLITTPTATGSLDASRRMACLIDLIINHINSSTWQVMQYPDTHATSNASSPTEKPTKPSEIAPPFAFSITNDAATGEGVISAFNTSLIITQTPEIQEEVGDLLKQLRSQK